VTVKKALVWLTSRWPDGLHLSLLCCNIPIEDRLLVKRYYNVCMMYIKSGSESRAFGWKGWCAGCVQQLIHSADSTS